MTKEDRYERSIRLFGKAGQKKIRKTHVLVIGVSGVGSPLTQQLAFLGPKQVTLIEPKDLSVTNRNRFVGARHSDPVPGSPKCELAARLIHEINPEIRVIPIKTALVSQRAFEAVKQADWVFGGFDHDGPRHILNELCVAYDRPYTDMASDVPAPGVYGGRVCNILNGNGCLHCLRVLDANAVSHYLSSEAERIAIDKIYGVPRSMLDQTGPSVAPINAVIAAQAALEFMVAVTGMRNPTRHIEYKSHLSIMTINKDPQIPNCPICKGIWGTQAEADVERYLRMPHLAVL